METGLQLKVSHDKMEKPGIEHVSPGLQGQGEHLSSYTMAAPMNHCGDGVSLTSYTGFQNTES